MNISDIITAIGGIGILLLGIVLMSEAIQKLAGPRFRKILANLTGGKFKALLTGMLVTTIIQASSATAIATIGFVSAGLITIPQALAVIFGANVGTTATAWLVTMFGIQYSIGQFSLLFVACGVILKILYTDHRSDIGSLLAGFGLLFFGITIMRQGLAQLPQSFNFTAISGHVITDRLLLFSIGFILTILMQSSSAAVVLALVALSSGTISLFQGQVLVIGMNAGKSIPILFAAIGATPDTRRIIVADVLFNTVTALVLFVLLPQLSPLLSSLCNAFGAIVPEIELSVFHTLFNVIGVLLFFPFITPFVRFLKTLFADTRFYLTQHLDDAIATTPAIAVETARRTVVDIALYIIQILKDMLQKNGTDIAHRLKTAQIALEETKHFMSKVKTPPQQKQLYDEHISVLHAIDHLNSIIEACQEAHIVSLLKNSTNFSDMKWNFNTELVESEKALKAESSIDSVEKIQELSQYLANSRKLERVEVLKKTATGQLDSHTALDFIEAIRFIDRLGYHIWRVVRHCIVPGDSNY
ncbi:MAG: Na/Pi symporter [Spirochaetota bacterium]|nr:Na/Pi symporter [Spirochaetota bacterium]